MGGQGDSRAARPNLYFQLMAPDGTAIYPKKQDGADGAWRWSPEKCEEEKDRIEWVKGRNGWSPYFRIYADSLRGRPPETIWPHDEVGSNRTSKAEIKALVPDQEPFGTPKPERLLKRVLDIATKEGDLVLDSFAGSGTTGAVAHKMGRRWIMVELGEHCHTHIIPRLKKVIDGEDKGGITEAVGWKGGGGFRYYRLAPSLLEKDEFGNWVISKKYNAAMLAEAMCKLEGFTYAPSDTVYWQHGHSTETDFIYVTTQTLTREQLQKLSDEVGESRSLLVMCGAFRVKNLDEFPNLTVKKIPKAVLNRCEWGKDDYSLEIKNLPMKAPDEEERTEGPSSPDRSRAPRRNGGHSSSATLALRSARREGRREMNPHVNTIANRLSLRPPQRESLEILARALRHRPAGEERRRRPGAQDHSGRIPTVTDFERDFPSLCFALATGVGKTRLMGAFIAYLFKAEGIRHFFVLAPNLTIYNKLIADFTPNTPKYVFQGIAEFAVEPAGDHHRRQLRERARRPGEDGSSSTTTSTSTSSTSRRSRARKRPRGPTRAMSLASGGFRNTSARATSSTCRKLDDLVLLMDESHRYRASAGMKAINELKPILGLELTATPQVETRRRNAAVPERHLQLSALERDDGRVRQGTRRRHPRELRCRRTTTTHGLERLKLEDGVRIHENTKVELEVYARENGKPIVKPFMLVIARDTEHANALMKAIEDEAFFEGRYKGKVIQVHSKQSGEEKGRNRRATHQCGEAGQSDGDRHPRQHAQRRLGRHEPLHHRPAPGGKLARRWWSSPSAAACACPTASGRAWARWTG